MNKRLEKRHKRQVSRAKERVVLSEPEARTPEQIKAARESSRLASGRRGGPDARYSKLSAGSPSRPAAHSTAKADA
jgi:hypothetical protein